MAENNHIAHPSRVDAAGHLSVLNALRTRCNEFCALNATDEKLKAIRVRDWRFCLEAGAKTVQLFIDRGSAHTDITFEECMHFHKWILETDVFDVFPDDVNIEIGSAGYDPCLRDPADFEAFVGKTVEVETWQKQEGRGKYKMILQEIADGRLHLREGPHSFWVPFENIKWAQGLTPEVASDKKPPKKGDKRQRPR